MKDEKAREMAAGQAVPAAREAARDAPGNRRGLFEKGEAGFRRIADSNLLGVRFGDSRGHISYINDEMLRMMGYTREDYEAGRINWKECVAPEYREELSEWSEQLKRDGVLPAYEKAFRRPDGTYTSYLGAAAMVDPAADFHVSVAVDFSRVRAAEGAMWESEQRFRIASSAMKLGVFEWNIRTGDVKWENRWMYDIFGRDYREGPVSWEAFCSDIMDPGDLPGYRETLESAMRGKAVFNTVCRIRRQNDGAKRWVKISGKFDTAEDGTALRLVGLVSDVTESREAEEERNHLKAYLEQQVAEKTAERTEQSDRLRALADRLGRVEQRERKQLAKTLHDNIQPMIVSARMHLWELKRTNKELHSLDTVDKVEHILEEALASLRSLTVDLSPPVLKSEGLAGALSWLSSRMKTQHELSVILYADRTVEPESEETTVLVFDCVKELLFNVVKHSGVTAADVAVSGTPGESLRVVVSDQGRGFDRDAVRKQNPREMTFGLFSIQERLAYIGGEMVVETEPGRGTKITVVVPAAAAPSEETEKELDAGTADVSDNRTIKVAGAENLIHVLIVDDHQVLREGLKGMLQLESDIKVVGEAPDGPQAIELADKLRPDVIVMDINLGEMDGVEACRRILSRQPDARIIGLSMYDDSSIAEAMRKAGAAAYLTKVAPSDELVDTIRRCC